MTRREGVRWQGKAGQLMGEGKEPKKARAMMATCLPCAKCILYCTNTNGTHTIPTGLSKPPQIRIPCAPTPLFLLEILFLLYPFFVLYTIVLYGTVTALHSIQWTVMASTRIPQHDTVVYCTVHYQIGVQYCMGWQWMFLSNITLLSWHLIGPQSAVQYSTAFPSAISTTHFVYLLMILYCTQCALLWHPRL